MGGASAKLKPSTAMLKLRKWTFFTLGSGGSGLRGRLGFGRGGEVFLMSAHWSQWSSRRCSSRAAKETPHRGQEGFGEAGFSSGSSATDTLASTSNW